MSYYLLDPFVFETASTFSLVIEDLIKDCTRSVQFATDARSALSKRLQRTSECMTVYSKKFFHKRRLRDMQRRRRRLPLFPFRFLYTYHKISGFSYLHRVCVCVRSHRHALMCQPRTQFDYRANVQMCRILLSVLMARSRLLLDFFVALITHAHSQRTINTISNVRFLRTKFSPHCKCRNRPLK